MATITAFDTLPPQPTLLPHQVEVPSDLLLPAVVRDIFACGVVSLVVLANQEQPEGSEWKSIPFERIDALAREHYALVNNGQPGGEMFADNPHVGIEIGVEILVDLGLIEIRREGCFSIALSTPLIDSLKPFLRH